MQREKWGKEKHARAVLIFTGNNKDVQGYNISTRLCYTVSGRGVQVFPDIPYRWLHPAVLAVAFLEWVYHIHDSGIMMALALV